MANEPKRHHYLPQSYLRQFSRDDLLWVYDREKDQVRPQKVLNTAVRRHFYSIEVDGVRDTRIESELAKVDALIPPLTQKLSARAELSEGERFDLSFIAALAMNRTPDFHEGIDRVEGKLIKRFSQRMFRSVEDAERSIAEWKAEDPSAPDVDPRDLYQFLSEGKYNVKIHRNRSIELMLTLSPEFAKTLAILNLGILHSPERSSFITTDRPFVIMPPRDTSKIPRWAGVGMLTPGAQKYFPLSSEIAIVFGDPGENFTHINLKSEQVKGVNASIGHMVDRFLIGRDLALVESWAKRLKLGTREKIRLMDVS